MGITVFGSVFVDIKGYSLSTYIPAGRNAGRVEFVHGGVCRNVAEDIANIELRPTFVSLIDDSGTSRDVVSKLKNHKVNTDYIRVTPDGLGTWLAVFNNNGDVVASISKRADMMPIDDILNECGDEIFAQSDSIVVEFDMPPKVVKHIIQLAQKHNKKVYAVISNISIALERRDLMKEMECFVCNQQEAGILFSEHYDDMTAEELMKILPQRAKAAQLNRMVVTLGAEGSIFVDQDGSAGYIPAIKVDVKDTTGAGDSFFAGVAVGLTYGKTLEESCRIGTRLAASVIITTENVCPRFLPSEFGLEVDLT